MIYGVSLITDRTLMTHEPLSVAKIYFIKIFAMILFCFPDL